MPFFKYTVANQQGKQLSGTVEASALESARTELNSLGFSIVSIEETAAMPKSTDQTLPKFIFEAVDSKSRIISGTIPSITPEEALKKLKDEYYLTVTAIWREGAGESEIATAKEKGVADLTAATTTKTEEEQSVNQEEIFVRNKVDFVLKKIYELLQIYGDKMDQSEKAEIQKKIDKLLRIKSSTNLDYIVTTAREILFAIQNQEKTLHARGFEDERISLELRTKELLGELKKSAASKTFSEDVLQKIETWQKANDAYPEAISSSHFIGRMLIGIKQYFTTPVEIKAIENQIGAYNKQLIEFAKLYFKEPSKEYKSKIFSSLRIIWKARTKAKHSLKTVKALRRERARTLRSEHSLGLKLLDEIASLTGWLLFFYILYYFAALYLSTKDFGLDKIPKGFLVYDSHIFKYILVIIFLLHSAISLKVNFFRKSTLADLFLIPFFFFGSIIVLINF